MLDRYITATQVPGPRERVVTKPIQHRFDYDSTAVRVRHDL